MMHIFIYVLDEMSYIINCYFVIMLFMYYIFLKIDLKIW